CRDVGFVPIADIDRLLDKVVGDGMGVAGTFGMTSSSNRRTLRRSRDGSSTSIRNPQIITPTPDAAKARMARVTVSGLPQTMSSGLRAIAPLGFLTKKASASDLACSSVSATCTALPIVDHSLASLIV